MISLKPKRNFIFTLQNRKWSARPLVETKMASQLVLDYSGNASDLIIPTQNSALRKVALTVSALRILPLLIAKSVSLKMISSLVVEI